jgi:two-component system, chemotaxis family, protein-glutamate methylesterase/glutaminase
MSQAIRVLVVDDSPFVCRLLTSYIEAAPDLRVAGTAQNGMRALAMIKRLQPDVVTLDLEMPEMDGITTLDHIMHECPIPVVMLSGISRHAAMLTLEAINMGAVDFILKYTPGVDTDPQVLQRVILAKVRAAAHIRVVRSVRLRQVCGSAVVPLTQTAKTAPVLKMRPLSQLSPLVQRVVVIGASTGGPTALRELLGDLPANFPAAIVVVQHMPETFTAVLAAQLDRAVALNVREARDGDRLEASQVLVAPGDYHLLLRADSSVQLTKGPAVGGHRPSVDVTMQSVAQVYGSRTLGVVLTGMGADGAMGLVAIHSKNGMAFAQDADSCVVDGMPQRARETGIVDYVDTPVQIARRLVVVGQPKPWRNYA